MLFCLQYWFSFVILFVKTSSTLIFALGSEHHLLQTLHFTEKNLLLLIFLTQTRPHVGSNRKRANVWFQASHYFRIKPLLFDQSLCVTFEEKDKGGFFGFFIGSTRALWSASHVAISHSKKSLHDPEYRQILMPF